MRRVATVVCAAAMVMFAASVFAQGGKDLVGKWTVDAEKTTAAGGRAGRGGGGGDLEIAVDGKVVTMTRTGQNGPTATKYTADGTTETTVQMGRGGEAKATAKFDGNKLVITTKGANGDQVASWYV